MNLQEHYFHDHSNSVQLRHPEKGDTGNTVKRLQDLLNSYDRARLKADGDFGSNPELAVKAFQKKHNLTTDGIVGSRTWAVLRQVAGIEGCSS